MANQNPLTLDALRVLDAIARRGSFAAAAEELHRVTSAVSYTVQKLEEDLGVGLFDRSGRRARLTAAGRLLVERGRELLAASQQLADDVRAAACGWEQRLTIALDLIYPETVLLPLVERFYRHQQEQGASTDVRIAGEVLGGPWDALETGRADIAIAPEQFALGKPFRSRRIGHISFRYVAAPDHPIFTEPAQTIDLENYRAVAVADTSRQRAPRSARIGKRQPTLTVSSFTAKIAALESGLGIGSMPENLIMEQLRRGSLRPLPGTGQEQLNVVMAWAPTEGRAKQWFLQQLPAFFAALEQEQVLQAEPASSSRGPKNS